MSTIAIITFRDGDEVYWVRRGHDGVPDVVIPDLEHVLGLAGNGYGARWSGAECGQLVSLFLAAFGDATRRLQLYELCTGLPGDECYVYSVEWRDGAWHARITWALGVTQED